MNIVNTRDLRKAIRTPYVWPGGYPMFLVMSDGGCLCMECARQNYREISSALRHNQRTSGWHPVATEINWEEMIFCDHCGKIIEAAYAAEED